ncbi:uncharacterized protein MONOS_5971 [Monocercomonoides exilis]|uniref:uncharacterized protein n=1 Tax=Monocercomonoides exilis TaxID=2049356 RepID=UPI00355A5972|nr:hypothetical protein MONOS_5971 [Monocercomonoides exilis]|eukprot:MONOS_5971.1-p1 / transcript=MONOS_5971.1 / gene=MONOS_5971 / organism=Monocercomonoides_exilis_PA203 / gene_product=unspecified product / transcript_product=unspecified product / location=Mono_scaffold00181:68349-72218(-) / protein_length=1151 / sequence_SO=supercontig / SO=protein_coding / is_pseudo=false
MDDDADEESGLSTMLYPPSKIDDYFRDCSASSPILTDQAFNSHLKGKIVRWHGSIKKVMKFELHVLVADPLISDNSPVVVLFLNPHLLHSFKYPKEVHKVFEFRGYLKQIDPFINVEALPFMEKAQADLPATPSATKELLAFHIQQTVQSVFNSDWKGHLIHLSGQFVSPIMESEAIKNFNEILFVPMPMGVEDDSGNIINFIYEQGSPLEEEISYISSTSARTQVSAVCRFHSCDGMIHRLLLLSLSSALSFIPEAPSVSQAVQSFGSYEEDEKEQSTCLIELIEDNDTSCFSSVKGKSEEGEEKRFDNLLYQAEETEAPLSPLLFSQPRRSSRNDEEEKSQSRRSLIPSASSSFTCPKAPKLLNNKSFTDLTLSRDLNSEQKSPIKIDSNDSSSSSSSGNSRLMHSPDSTPIPLSLLDSSIDSPNESDICTSASSPVSGPSPFLHPSTEPTLIDSSCSSLCEDQFTPELRSSIFPGQNSIASSPGSAFNSASRVSRPNAVVNPSHNGLSPQFTTSTQNALSPHRFPLHGASSPFHSATSTPSSSSSSPFIFNSQVTSTVPLPICQLSPHHPLSLTFRKPASLHSSLPSLSNSSKDRRLHASLGPLKHDNSQTPMDSPNNDQSSSISPRRAFSPSTPSFSVTPKRSRCSSPHIFSPVLTPPSSDPIPSSDFFKNVSFDQYEADNNWICPITGELMLNPVVAADGGVYEHSAIFDFVNLFRMSPMTFEPMENALFSLDADMKHQIQMYLNKYPERRPRSHSRPTIRSASCAPSTKWASSSNMASSSDCDMTYPDRPSLLSPHPVFMEFAFSHPKHISAHFCTGEGFVDPFFPLPGVWRVLQRGRNSFWSVIITEDKKKKEKYEACQEANIEHCKEMKKTKITRKKRSIIRDDDSSSENSSEEKISECEGDVYHHFDPASRKDSPQVDHSSFFHKLQILGCENDDTFFMFHIFPTPTTPSTCPFLSPFPSHLLPNMIALEEAKLSCRLVAFLRIADAEASFAKTYTLLTGLTIPQVVQFDSEEDCRGEDEESDYGNDDFEINSDGEYYDDCCSEHDDRLIENDFEMELNDSLFNEEPQLNDDHSKYANKCKSNESTLQNNANNNNLISESICNDKIKNEKDNADELQLKCKKHKFTNLHNSIIKKKRLRDNE